MRETNFIEGHNFSLHKVDLDSRKKGLYTRLLAISILIAIVFIGFSSDANLSPRAGWFLAGAGMLFLIGLLKQTKAFGWLSPPITYLVIFWVFHFGLVFPAAIMPGIIDLFPGWGRDWLFFPQTSKAILMAILFILTFSFGVIMFYRRPPEGTSRKEFKEAPELVGVGWVVIGLGILWATISLINFGLSIFLQNYQTFYKIHNAFSWPLIIIATGLLLQAAGGRPVKSILITILWAFAPLAVLVISAGSRTAVIFSSVALATVLYERGLHVSKTALLIGTILLLILTSTIKSSRIIGLSAVIEQQSNVSIGDPLDGLTELGGSLRPVTAVIDYAEDHPYFYGETFALPILRQVERFTGSRKNVLLDDRFIASRINRLYGSIGFSVAAEGYVNGGPAGVALVGLILGIVLGLLTRYAYLPYGLAILAISIIPILINIRNSFVFVPAWIILGILPIIFARLIAKRDSIKSISGNTQPANIL